MTEAAELSDQDFERYARHLILDEIGEAGQARLLRSRVLVVGAGGLGAPALLYLAAAGVGTIGIVDDDVVELSNLQRQIIHATERIGAPKTASATEALHRVNPGVRVEPHQLRLVAANARGLVRGYDIVVDGSDNFATRFLVNDTCFAEGKTLVSAALLRFDAQISTFKAHLGPPHPCYRCLFPEPPPPGLVPRCEEAGILGALAGTVGSLQAIETVKELLGLGESLSGWLLLYESLEATFRKIRVPRDPNCALCGGVAPRAGLAGLD